MNVELRELTAPRRGAVAVVEVRGSDAADFTERHTGHPPPAAGSFRLRRLSGNGEWIDEALVLTRPDGVIEWHLHGGASVLQQVLALVPPERRLQPAADPLVQARTRAAARIVLDQREGAAARERQLLVGLAPEQREQRAELLRLRMRMWQHLERPTRVLLLGPVNAGKSTLFNALCSAERALVSPVAGTTRDLLLEEVQLGPWPILLIDSAGLRAGSDALEAEGQRRAEAERAQADWVLWVDPRADGERHAPPGSLWIRSRCGLELEHAVQALEDPVTARQRLRALFERERSLPHEPWQPGECVPLSESDLRFVLG
jgi:tRNA U34 5-carboxymethylaminomethyl modifying GTPase MnmE/TrmE